MFSRLATLLDCSTSRLQKKGRTRRRIHRVEGLEHRCLLSGIASVTDYNLPTASACAHRGSWWTRTPGNLWFIEPGANDIGMINPTTHAISRVRHPNGKRRSLGHHGGA